MKCVSVLNSTLHNIFENNSKVYLIGEDIIDPYGGAFKISKGLSSKYNNRVIPTPLSEGAMVGVASGMALKGLLPIVEIMFGDFLSLTFDQVFNYLIKFNQMYAEKVDPHVVIRSPMGAYRGYGPTHSQSMEKYFIGMPNLKVYSIGYLGPINEMYYNIILKDRGPVLIIENKILYSYDNHDLSSGIFDDFKANISWNKENTSYTIRLKLDESSVSDYTIVTYGGVTPLVINAVKDKFMDDELNGEIIIITNLSTIDFDNIENSLKESRSLITVEEGTQGMSIGTKIIEQIVINNINLLKKEPIIVSSPANIIPNSKEKEAQFLPSVDLIKEKIDKLT